MSYWIQYNPACHPISLLIYFTNFNTKKKITLEIYSSWNYKSWDLWLSTSNKFRTLQLYSYYIERGKTVIFSNIIRIKFVIGNYINNDSHKNLINNVIQLIIYHQQSRIPRYFITIFYEIKKAKQQKLSWKLSRILRTLTTLLRIEYNVILSFICKRCV